MKIAKFLVLTIISTILTTAYAADLPPLYLNLDFYGIPTKTSEYNGIEFCYFLFDHNLIVDCWGGYHAYMIYPENGEKRIVQGVRTITATGATNRHQVHADEGGCVFIGENEEQSGTASCIVRRIDEMK